MEEKNEDIENIEIGTITEPTETIEKKQKKGLFSRIFGLMKFCITFLIMSFIAFVVSIYYVKDVRDMVKKNFPDINIPTYFAHNNGEIEPQKTNTDSLTPISNLVRKDEKTPVIVAEMTDKTDSVLEVKENNESVVETVVTENKQGSTQENSGEAVAEAKIAEVVTEVKVAEIKEVKMDTEESVAGKTPVKTEVVDVAVELSEEKTAEVVVPPSSELKEGTGDLNGTVIKTEEVIASEVSPIDNKEIAKEVMAKVKEMTAENKVFNEASFDPIKKGEEVIPADKYSSLPLEDKFLDLMVKNADLVAVVKQMNERIARLETDRVDRMVVNAIIEKLERINVKVLSMPANIGNSSLLIASSHLRYAILSGESFIYELDTIKLLAKDNKKVSAELAKLDNFAVLGVKTNEALKEEFISDTAKADGHILMQSSDDLKGKILSKVNELVVIKRIDGRPINEKLLALYNEVLPLIEKNDIEGAISKIKENQETKAFFKEFLYNAMEKADALRIINSITTIVSESFKAQTSAVNEKTEAKPVVKTETKVEEKTDTKAKAEVKPVQKKTTETKKSNTTKATTKKGK